MIDLTHTQLDGAWAALTDADIASPPELLGYFALLGATHPEWAKSWTKDKRAFDEQVFQAIHLRLGQVGMIDRCRKFEIGTHFDWEESE